MAMALPPLPARLTHADADAYLRLCDTVLLSASGAAQPLDASALVEFDSSALAVMLAVRRRLAGQGQALHVTGMTQRLRDLATLYGVSELLPA